MGIVKFKKLEIILIKHTKELSFKKILVLFSFFIDLI